MTFSLVALQLNNGSEESHIQRQKNPPPTTKHEKCKITYEKLLKGNGGKYTNSPAFTLLFNYTQTHKVKQGPVTDSDAFMSNSRFHLWILSQIPFLLHLCQVSFLQM